MQNVNEAYEQGFTAGQNDIIENKILEEYNLPVVTSNEIVLVDGEDYNPPDDNPDNDYLAVKKVKVAVAVQDPDVDPDTVEVKYDDIPKVLNGGGAVDNPVEILPGFKPISPSDEVVRYSSMKKVKFELQNFNIRISPDDLQYDENNPGTIIPTGTNGKYIGLGVVKYVLTNLMSTEGVQANRIFPPNDIENRIASKVIPYTMANREIDITPEDGYQAMANVNTFVKLVDVDIPYKGGLEYTYIDGEGGYWKYDYNISEAPTVTSPIGMTIPNSGLQSIDFNLKGISINHNTLYNGTDSSPYSILLSNKEKAGFDYTVVEGLDEQTRHLNPVIGFKDGIDVHILRKNRFSQTGDSLSGNTNNNRPVVKKVRAQNRTRGLLRGVGDSNESDDTATNDGVTYYDSSNKVYVNNHTYTVEDENNYAGIIDPVVGDGDDIGFRSCCQSTVVPIIDNVRVPEVTSNGLVTFSIDDFNNNYSNDAQSVNPYRNDFIGVDTIEIPVNVNNLVIPLTDATVNNHIYRPTDYNPNAIGFSVVHVNVPAGEGNANLTELTINDLTLNGVYNPHSPYNGFSRVNVDVARVNNYNQPTITSNGTYSIPNNYTGLSDVTVDIPLESNKLVTLTSSVSQAITPSEITANSNEYYTAMRTVTVTPNLYSYGTLNNGNYVITENGSYPIPAGYCGIGDFTVNVPTQLNLYTGYKVNTTGGQGNPYRINKLNYNKTYYGGYNNSILYKYGSIDIPNGYDGLGKIDYEISFSTPEKKANIGDSGVVDSEYTNYTVTSNGYYGPASTIGLAIEKFKVNVVPNLENGVLELSSVNGQTFTPSSGYDGFSQVSIDPLLVTPNGNGNITSNGTFVIPNGYCGFNNFTVNITPNLYNSYTSSNPLVIDDTVVDENCTGVISIPQGYTGFGNINIDVDITSPRKLTSQEEESVDPLDYQLINTSGIYEPSGNGIGILPFRVDVNEIMVSKNYTLDSSSATTISPDLGYDGMAQVVVTPNLYNATNIAKIGSNGTYNPPEGYCGFGEIDVDVEPNLTTGTYDLENVNGQTFTPSNVYDGFSQITVEPKLISPGSSGNITTNGTYLIPSGYCGFNNFSVNVNSVDNADVDSVNNNVITSNGTFTVPNGKTGWNSFSVDINTVDNADVDSVNNNVITSNGIFTVPNGKTGWNSFSVNIPSVSSNLLSFDQGLYLKDKTSVDSSIENKRIYTFNYSPPSGYDGYSNLSIKVPLVKNTAKFNQTNFVPNTYTTTNDEQNNVYTLTENPTTGEYAGLYSLRYANPYKMDCLYISLNNGPKNWLGGSNESYSNLDGWSLDGTDYKRDWHLVADDSSTATLYQKINYGNKYSGTLSNTNTVFNVVYIIIDTEVVTLPVGSPGYNINQTFNRICFVVAGNAYETTNQAIYQIPFHANNSVEKRYYIYSYFESHKLRKNCVLSFLGRNSTSSNIDLCYYNVCSDDYYSSYSQDRGQSIDNNVISYSRDSGFFSWKLVPHCILGKFCGMLKANVTS